MAGLTLLNIDREREHVTKSLDEITRIIDEIFGFLKQFPPETPAVRLVPLKMKIRQLQDAVSQFGTDGSIEINEKQEVIMDLHSKLQLLTNNLVIYPGNYTDTLEIISNYLLNHLCTTAAVDPRATVIGVSNVMAQVLSKGIDIIQPMIPTGNQVDLNYFETFVASFNHMLTTAGLFAAPVLGLPDIPLSQLGSWSDQAITQFAILSNYIDNYYRILPFFKIEQELNAQSFDIITDLLEFYFYLNDFFSALITRADILSGIEFPSEFSIHKKSIILQSTTQITETLADSLELNCKKIESHLGTLHELYKDGKLDKNDNPTLDKTIQDYSKELHLWRMIAHFAKLMVIFFTGKHDTFHLDPVNRSRIEKKLKRKQNLPPFHNPIDVELDILNLVSDYTDVLRSLFLQSELTNEMDFIQSSQFTNYRSFLQYLVHMVAAHDIFINTEFLWNQWLLEQYGKFFLNQAKAFNPHTTLEVGLLGVVLGIRERSSPILEEGIALMNSVKPFLEFQLHHYLAIEVISHLVKRGIGEYDVDGLIELLDNFLVEYQINPISLIYQRVSLYKGMLEIYKTGGEEENPFFLMPPRYVSLDPFTWILVPKIPRSFPYITLNSSLTNLSSG